MQRGVRHKIFFFIFLLCTFILPFIPETKSELYGNTWTGPWVNKLKFKVIQDETRRVEALINGDVDIIGGQINPIYLDELKNSENVEVSENLRFGYGIIYFNCMKWPFNITNFRRAVAFAIDKHRIIEEGWLGHAELLDCHIPQQHPACIDDEMEYHYYDKQVSKGIELLEAAGFVDTDNDTWREGPGPKGPGTIALDTIVVEARPSNQNLLFLDIVHQALTDLGIYSQTRETSWQWPTAYRMCPGVRDNDIWLFGQNWKTFDLDHYARDMSSDSLEIMNMNYPNWSNATWDSLVPTVLHSLDYDEILAAVRKMERIWVHACPAIVMYQNNHFTAYRKGSHEGFVISPFSGVPNFYTNLRVHKIDSHPIWGTFTWANPLDILSFNHYSANSAYASNILQMLFDPLVRFGPDGEDILWMCESYKVLTHDDYDFIPEGHIRFIIDIVKNATWSDGTPITANDFVFTLEFIRDNVPVVGYDIQDLVTCYANTNYQFICEFDTISFWHWHNIAYKSVIPRHIWIDYADAYDAYQPTPDEIHEMVVSGPFIPKNWTQGVFIKLIQNPNYWKNPRLLELENWSTQYNETTMEDDSLIYLYPILISIGAFTCFVVTGISYLKKYDPRA